MSQASTYPSILPVDTAPIPDLLKGLRRWLPWRAGPHKPTGKFDKIPIDPTTGRNLSAVDPANWVTFDVAMQACRKGAAQGIGIALSDKHPVMLKGQPLFLTAVDLDNCRSQMNEYKLLWRQLGKPYVEVSPSGKGLRMLGLSCTAVRGGNAGDGKELYATGRFVTVTGHGGRGSLCEFTSGITMLERNWFGDRTTSTSPRKSLLSQPLLPEQRAFVEPVLSMLDAISSNTDYDTWRDIIYSVASTGWVCARHILHIWSKRALHRYDAAVLDKLFDSFDPARGITLGTLAYHARKNGWTGQPPPVLQMLPSTPTPGQSVAPLLMTALQLRALPAPHYVVRNVFPAQGLAAIYGEPGSGKSFLALDLAHAIAAGTVDWFGFRVRQRPVVYVVLEGVGGMGKRTTALELHSKQPCSDQLRFWCRGIHLLTGEGIDLLAMEVVAAVGMGAVVIVDTLNQASPGADENTSQDMGKIIAHSKHLAASVGGLAILVHHAGKNRAQGLRGHSSLHAAMDAVIEVATVDGKHKAWSITKAKDDSSDVKRDFDLVPYTVGQDEFGDPITSCAVQHTIHATPLKLKAPTGKHQKAALAELRSQLQQPGSGVDYNKALALVAAALNAPQDKKAERAKEAVQTLIRDGHLILNDLGVCLA
ncbi:MAG: AAA family ATPase [Erythrobacter sp.]|nr:AAA family ATPase [Erythrobacter sp.]